MLTEMDERYFPFHCVWPSNMNQHSPSYMLLVLILGLNTLSPKPSICFFVNNLREPRNKNVRIKKGKIQVLKFKEVNGTGTPVEGSKHNWTQEWVEDE